FHHEAREPLPRVELGSLAYQASALPLSYRGDVGSSADRAFEPAMPIPAGPRRADRENRTLVAGSSGRCTAVVLRPRFGGPGGTRTLVFRLRAGGSPLELRARGGFWDRWSSFFRWASFCPTGSSCSTAKSNRDPSGFSRVLSR